MLETEIKDLKNEIRDLRLVINNLFLHLNNGKDTLPPVETEPEKAEAAPVEEAPADAVTHKELQDLCLAMVRKDRKLKTAIKDALAEYGANVMADVPADKLPALKATLEAMQ